MGADTYSTAAIENRTNLSKVLDIHVRSPVHQIANHMNVLPGNMILHREMFQEEHNVLKVSRFLNKLRNSRLESRVCKR